jgi:hypothetical protein
MTMPNPLVVLEMVAWWPLVVGLFVLIFHRRLLAFLSRMSPGPTDPMRQRALSLALVFGALFFIDLGLGGMVWSFAPPAARIAIVVVVLAIALPLSFLMFGYARGARTRRP